MKHIVKMDEEGHLIYDGLLSSKEKATIDEILNALQIEIPQIESDLSNKYGSGVLYKYYLGKFLSELLQKYNITPYERRQFWDEIKTLATKEKRIRSEGVNAITRSFYEQCYVLSQYDLEVVQKLSWRQWQGLLDRVGIREDERLFIWIKNREEKIKEDELREFGKGLNLYLKNKDTSVFSDEELFEIYNSIFSMCQYWIKKFAEFSKNNPKSKKINKKTVLSQKYFTNCFKIKKETRKSLNEEVFDQAFELTIK